MCLFELGNITAKAVTFLAKIREKLSQHNAVTLTTEIKVLRSHLKHNFDEVISDDEYITWISAPNFYAYIFSALVLFVVAMSYGFFSAFDLFIKEISNTNVSSSEFNWAVLIPLLIIAFCVCNLFCKIKSHSKTFYAKTNKRIILRSGVWGAKYTSIKLSRISCSQVRVGFFDVPFRTGIITFKTGEVDSDGDSLVSGEMLSIPNPYEAYKILSD